MVPRRERPVEQRIHAFFGYLSLGDFGPQPTGSGVMALWNPFNLFKKKSSESTPENQASTTEPAAAEISAEPLVAPRDEPTEAQADTPRTPVPAEPSESETGAWETETAETAASASPALEPVVDLPVDLNPVEPEPPVEPALPVQPTAEEKAIDSPADETAVEDRSEAEMGNRNLPFDQQQAPNQPVDVYEKISRKPGAENRTSEAEEETAGGLAGWFRTAVSKTAKVLNTDIRDLVGREGRLVDDAFLKELFAHLIKTDMGVGPASEIRDAIGKKYRARKVHLSQLIEEAKTTIANIMKQEEVRLQLADQGTTIIMVVGVNGSGKTTSIAKLARMFRQDGKSVVLGAGDTFRAAAVEQLRQWAGRIGAEIVTGEDQADPASVAYRAADFAKQNNIDICIVDTAGRLQTQTHLMQELSKIRRVLDKVIPGAPHETLLVLDSTAGQNAISQARGFSDAADCSGIVLAKLDGTAKGGVAIPIRQEFGLPVKFIGFGETADAIAPFDVPRYVDALFNFDPS